MRGCSYNWAGDGGLAQSALVGPSLYKKKIKVYKKKEEKMHIFKGHNDRYQNSLDF